MPPVLGGGGAAAMAVLPASPQTATQGNPHPHHHNQTGQTQLLLGAGGNLAQPQPQLLYQPYNLMSASSPSQATGFQHHHPSSGQQHQAFLSDPAITFALERREAEVREIEKREREAKMEREKIEKQRAAEQAVHKHFEESLRLAQQKRNMQSASMAWNSFIPHTLPPPGSRTHPSPQSGISSHGHHHPGVGGSQHQSAVQQQHRDREERDSRDRERDTQARDREQREREREHLVAAERLHRQAEVRDHVQRTAYYTQTSAQQVLRPSSVPSKVDYVPPPAHSRSSKSSLSVVSLHEKQQNIGPPHSGLPKAEPNVSLFSYSAYQSHQAAYIHDIKVKNELQHKAHPGKNVSIVERDHHGRDILPNPPPLLPDHKSSVIVKNDQGREIQKLPHSSSPKIISYHNVQVPSQVAPQHKPVTYEYRSPTQSPHHLDNLQAKSLQQNSSNHHRSSGASQHPLSPHGHPPHTHNRQSPLSHPHQISHPSPPEPRYLSRSESGLPYTTSKSSYSYPHPSNVSPTSHYTTQPGSKPKVSSPAPPHMYGKPNSGIITGPANSRTSELSVVSVPLPLTSKAGSSPYQPISHHHGTPSQPLSPPPAHSRGSIFDSRGMTSSKLPMPPVHGSPPTGASTPLSRPPITHPGHHMGPHQPTSLTQQSMVLTNSIQTQPLDLGIERANSPKRKAPIPSDHCNQPMALEIKKRRTDEPPSMVLQSTGPLALSKVNELIPLTASAAPSITAVVNTTIITQQNPQNPQERLIISISPAPRTASGDGSVRPASTGSVSSITLPGNNPSTAPSPASAASPAPSAAAPSPAPSVPGTPAKTQPTNTDSEKSNSPAPRPPSTTNYPVHKLKKAWLQRHSGEDGAEDTTGVVGSGSCVTLPLNITQAPSQPINKERETLNTSTTSLPSAVNSIHNIGSMAINSINKSKAGGKGGRKPVSKESTVNGHGNDAKSNLQEDSSSSDPDRRSPPKRKPPKVKRKKGAARRQQAAVEDQRRRKDEKQVTGAGSDSSNESEGGSVSDTSEQLSSSIQSTSRRHTTVNSTTTSGNGNNKEPRKRGRRPKNSKGNDAGGEDQQPRQKKERRDDSSSGGGDGGGGGGNGQGGGNEKTNGKPPIAQLKKTGESWLQDNACCEVTPKLVKLSKCRECRFLGFRGVPSRIKKQSVFCRFYEFRRLRYTKNGQLAIAGFSDPYKDATEEDMQLWLPGNHKRGEKREKNKKSGDRADLDLEMAHRLLRQVGDQFCDLLRQEKEALAEHMADAQSGIVDGTVAWKRVVQGVRELCDVCETTLFNYHWVCAKCGFAVCIDCFKGRKNGTIKIWGESGKDRDEFSWLLCTNRHAHAPDRLMLTQIIAGDSLPQLGQRLHEARTEWGIPQHCSCSMVTNTPSNDVLRNLIKGDSVTVANGTVKQDENLETRCKDANGTSSNKANGEDKNSPLNWLADVALQNQDKNDSGSSSSDSDEDREGNYSTLRELLIRPSHKPNANGSRSNSPTNTTNNSQLGINSANNIVKTSKKSKMDTLDEVISSVIEHTVKKERDGVENDDKSRELKHFVRRYKWTERGREPLPIRIMTLTESKSLYPDVSHSWLCDGKLLRLNDPNNVNNYRIFQDQWKRGQPVIVSDVSKSLDMDLWHPDSFARDFGNEKNDLINCMNNHIVPNQPMRKFWEGFEHFSKRLKDDKGNPMLLKLKDWPPGEDFAELLPSRYADLMKVLPLSEYTHRNGRLNLASRLPDKFVRPDLGPKMYNAYGSALHPNKGTTNLHLDISDAVNVMVYVGIPKDGDNDEHVKEALRAIDEAGCDILTRRRVRDRGEAPGALWHIYAARDADKIRDLLNAVALERGARLEPHHDPIHDQSCYLDGPLRERLYREYGVEGYAIVQCLGDAVFVPAGAPHQVRNLHNCIKVAEDFVSPENVSHCFHLTQEFRALSDTHTNHEDKLQIKNIIYHAVKDSLTVLANAKEETLSKLKTNNEVKIKEET